MKIYECSRTMGMVHPDHLNVLASGVSPCALIAFILAGYFKKSKRES